MRARLTFLFLYWLLPLYAGFAAFSLFATLMFHDVRRVPLGEYLVDYLIPRFFDFFTIFAAPVPMIALAFSGLLFYELTRWKP